MSESVATPQVQADGLPSVEVLRAYDTALVTIRAGMAPIFSLDWESFGGESEVYGARKAIWGGLRELEILRAQFHVVDVPAVTTHKVVRV